MSDRDLPGEVTLLLSQWSEGDQSALSKIMPLVEDELKRLARSYMKREPQNHTLQPTALVNEAYLRLVGQRSAHWESKAHFVSIAATLMRRILVDSARRRKSLKRGGLQIAGSLDELTGTGLAASDPQSASIESLLALDEAMNRLQEISPRQCEVVELRYFGGLSNQEISDFLEVSIATVKRDWTAARSWLFLVLSEGEPPA